MDTVIKLFTLVGLLLAFASTPSSAREGSGQDGADRWVPSVALISGITFQDWKAGVSSSICRGCMIPDPMEEELRPGATGDDLDVSPFFGTSIELMTPELPLPGSPRFFFGAEVAGVFGAKRQLAQNGEPGEVGNPAPEQAQDSTGFGDDIALGQGSETVAKIEDTSYGATFGIAFPFEVYGRTFRIKPAFSWIRYEVAIDGLVVDAECSFLRFPPGTTVTECNTTPPQNGFLRETRLGASRTVTFDGIGPSLDIEMDTGRLGPLGTSLFMGARFYRTVGGRKVQFDSEIETFDDELGQDSSQAQFHFEVDEWMYRIGVGLRFQWLGFKK